MLIGVVESIVDSKTIKVVVVNTFRHGLYGKVLNTKSKLLCHCDNVNVSVGDNVRIAQSRKFSKKKCHIVL